MSLDKYLEKNFKKLFSLFLNCFLQKFYFYQNKYHNN